MKRRLAVVLASLVAVTGLALAASGGATIAPADETETPHGVEDRETFTVSTGAILLEEGGRICAEKVEPDVNEVTITGAELVDVRLYHQGGVDKRIEMPRAELDGELVVYTNGANAQVNALATANACVPLDQPSRTTLEAYYMTSDVLDATGLSIQTGEDVAADVPEPGGLDVGDLGAGGPNGTAGDGNVTGDLDGTVGPVTDAATGSAPPVGETTDAVTGTVGDAPDAVNGSAEAVDETTGGVVDVTNSTTDTVDDATDDTTDTVDGTTSETTDAVDGTVNDTTDAVDGAGGTDTSATVDDTTDDRDRRRHDEHDDRDRRRHDEHDDRYRRRHDEHDDRRGRRRDERGDDDRGRYDRRAVRPDGHGHRHPDGHGHRHPDG